MAMTIDATNSARQAYQNVFTKPGKSPASTSIADSGTTEASSASSASRSSSGKRQVMQYKIASTQQVKVTNSHRWGDVRDSVVKVGRSTYESLSIFDQENYGVRGYVELFNLGEEKQDKLLNKIQKAIDDGDIDKAIKLFKDNLDLYNADYHKNIEHSIKSNSRHFSEGIQQSLFGLYTKKDMNNLSGTVKNLSESEESLLPGRVSAFFSIGSQGLLDDMENELVDRFESRLKSNAEAYTSDAVALAKADPEAYAERFDPAGLKGVTGDIYADVATDLEKMKNNQEGDNALFASLENSFISAAKSFYNSLHDTLDGQLLVKSSTVNIYTYEPVYADEPGESEEENGDGETTTAEGASTDALNGTEGQDSTATKESEVMPSINTEDWYPPLLQGTPMDFEAPQWGAHRATAAYAEAEPITISGISLNASV